MRRDRTAVLHFFAQIVRSLAGFGTTLFTARYFGAGGVGFYSQILALLFWLKLPSNSIKTAVSKRMSETDQRTGHFSAGLIAALGYGVAVGVVAIALEGYVNSYLGADATHFLILLLAVNIVFDLVKSGFVGRKRVAISGWLGTFEQILRLISQVAFVLGGALVIGLVYGHIVSLFVFTLIGLFLLRDRLVIPSASDFTDLRRFAQYSWLGNLRGVALNWMDVLVLGLFVGDDLVGIYTAAWTLASFLSLANKSIKKTLFPEFSELGTDERYDRATSLINDGLMFAGIFLIPGVFGALIVGDRVLAVYESEFAIGANILVLLIAARLFQGLGSQFAGALNGLDYPEVAFRINAVFFGSNVVLNFVLVWAIGWYGAAIATLSSTVLYLLVAWRLLVAEVGHVELPVGEIARQFLAAVVMAVALQPILPLLPGGLGGTLLAVVTGAAIYGSTLVGISGRVREKLRRVVNV
ncbi:oligosaccharide flippase family protein [Halosimplex sp. J119]